jgi:site-specific recombinase XerD
MPRRHREERIQGPRKWPEEADHQVSIGIIRKAALWRLCRTRHNRHTFALHYLRQNPGKLVELASLLGHESLDTTALYTRPSIDDLAEDLERSRLNVYG